MAHSTDKTVTSSGDQILPANSLRDVLILQCPSSSPEKVRVTLDGTTPSATLGIELSPGGGGLTLTGTACPQGAVMGWSAGDGGTVAAYEASRLSTVGGS